MMTLPDTTTTAEPEPMTPELVRELTELRTLRQRACALASTPGLGGAAQTYAHAGRFVLGLAPREMKL